MLVVKIGGGKTIDLEAIIKDLGGLSESYIVVHGANALRDEIGEKMGSPTRTIVSASGYSSVRTDDRAMDLFMMSYPGLRNTRLVEVAQRNEINAIGLSGLDGQLIRGERKKAIKAREGDKIKLIRDDLSGRPKELNVDLLQSLLSQGYVPFICPPILSYEGEAINTENDSIVSLLVEKLGNVDTVIHLLEAPGLLKDASDQNSLICRIAKEELESAEEEFTKGRMKRKMLAVRESFKHGVKQVIFADGRTEEAITRALNGEGTIIE